MSGRDAPGPRPTAARARPGSGTTYCGCGRPRRCSGRVAFRRTDLHVHPVARAQLRQPCERPGRRRAVGGDDEVAHASRPDSAIGAERAGADAAVLDAGPGGVVRRSPVGHDLQAGQPDGRDPERRQPRPARPRPAAVARRRTRVSTGWRTVAVGGGGSTGGSLGPPHFAGRPALPCVLGPDRASGEADAGHEGTDQATDHHPVQRTSAPGDDLLSRGRARTRRTSAMHSTVRTTFQRTHLCSKRARASSGGSVLSSRLFRGTLTTPVITSVATYSRSAAAVQPIPSSSGQPGDDRNDAEDERPSEDQAEHRVQDRRVHPAHGGDEGVVVAARDARQHGDAEREVDPGHQAGRDQRGVQADRADGVHADQSTARLSAVWWTSCSPCTGVGIPSYLALSWSAR